jgi:hypothetical protein
MWPRRWVIGIISPTRTAEDPLSGRFKAAGSFELQSRGLFVIHGELANGVARIGQFASAPDGFVARVHGVEFVRLADGHEDLALTFVPRDAAEAARWRGRAFSGEELDLAERRPD